MRPVADINLKDQHYLSIISLWCNKMKRNKELYLCSPVEQLAKALSAMKHNELEVVLSWSSILGLQLLNTSLLTVSEPQEQKKKMLVINLICISSNQKHVRRREDLRSMMPLQNRTRGRTFSEVAEIFEERLCELLRSLQTSV